VAVWATDSVNGLPAGVVHLNGHDSYGRPGGPACGARALRFFAGVDLDDVPPRWRCPDCGAVEGD
jgi:rubredoxin